MKKSSTFWLKNLHFAAAAAANFGFPFFTEN